MRVWKAYGLGAGRLRTETCSSGDLPSVVMFQAHTDRFSGVKRRTSTQQSTEKHENEDQEPKDTDNEPPKPSSDGDLFTCPEKGCTKTFMRYSSIMQHLDCGKHQRILERETLFDKAAYEYAEQLEGQATFQPQVSGVSIETSGVNRRPMAWALKTSGSGRARFTVKTRNPT